MKRRRRLERRFRRTLRIDSNKGLDLPFCGSTAI